MLTLQNSSMFIHLFIMIIFNFKLHSNKNKQSLHSKSRHKKNGIELSELKGNEII